MHIIMRSSSLVRMRKVRKLKKYTLLEGVVLGQNQHASCYWISDKHIQYRPSTKFIRVSRRPVLNMFDICRSAVVIGC